MDYKLTFNPIKNVLFVGYASNSIPAVPRGFALLFPETSGEKPVYLVKINGLIAVA
jgi:hypothetical protein